MAQDKVFITHACQCIGSGGFMYGVYGILPMPLAYLMGFKVEDVRHRGDGGWEWESRLRQWPSHHHEPALVEMRHELALCHDTGDFERLCGAGSPVDRLPPPGPNDEGAAA